ncbi:GNAT family N-acetyltransferase [Paenalcaligenes suwonensis]|uniref:GNAT family N-acetyltransferase n=1 Tax=Paenalcaligenes suwonensis TaxID=1202713 RepID=UPI0014099595|nr:GNAT family protein [Paenalcaligenes suwonensis]NHC62377.1 GNAT family N-acetyltransferase [Paenalcaligenes suwonensis]
MAAPTWLTPVTLQGTTVTLRPLQTNDREALLAAARDGELWKLWFTSVPSVDSIDAYLSKAFADRDAGVALPFAVIDNATGELVGSTRFCNADVLNQRVEIGYTWYAKRCQRTAINTESKLLLLTHAFENRAAIAVELRTNWHNHASRQAIARLGAKQDGVLRNHQKMPNGGYRDTVVFSILNHEWPSVKQALASRLL